MTFPVQEMAKALEQVVPNRHPRRALLRNRRDAGMRSRASFTFALAVELAVVRFPGLRAEA